MELRELKLEGEYDAIAAVQEKEQEGLLAKANVVGVAVGHKIKGERETGDPSLTIMVAQKMDPEMLSPEDRIASTIGKFKTDVVETGYIFAGGNNLGGFVLEEPRFKEKREVVIPVEEEDLRPRLKEEEVEIQVLRNRVRPAKGGYSCGHYRITAGTYGTAVIDRTPFPGIPRKFYILSNNHVLANSNDATVGDPILQPGRVDGGQLPRDIIARLTRFVPIRFGGTLANYVDAAIAEGQFHELDREIYWVGQPKEARPLTRIGEVVQKTGRTTNWTTGTVTGLNATVNVNYGGGRVARMVRQITTTNMSAGGDSGSVLLNMQGNAVGLLFAGSSRITIHNHMAFVQALLGIRV